VLSESAKRRSASERTFASRQSSPVVTCAGSGRSYHLPPRVPEASAESHQQSHSIAHSDEIEQAVDGFAFCRNFWHETLPLEVAVNHGPERVAAVRQQKVLLSYLFQTSEWSALTDKCKPVRIGGTANEIQGAIVERVLHESCFLGRAMHDPHIKTSVSYARFDLTDAEFVEYNPHIWHPVHHRPGRCHGLDAMTRRVADAQHVAGLLGSSRTHRSREIIDVTHNTPGTGKELGTPRPSAASLPDRG
jgi:hypothetical protein